jgi:diacylglycerol kinase (ATP)
VAGNRALVVVNRAARRGGSSIDAALAVLRDAGIEPDEQRVPDPAMLPQRIVAEREKYGLVVLGGGDGTLSAAAPGLIESGLPLGILPLGTANDLARTLGLPFDPVAAARVIVAGRRQRIDLGRVNGRPFFNVAHLGLSVTLTTQLTPARKKRWGKLSYAISAAQVLTEARRFGVELVCDGERAIGRSIQVAVGNGKYYGGGNAVATDATIDDGTFDVYSLEPRNRWRLLLMLPWFRRGAHGSWPEVRAMRCRHLVIRTRRPRKITADGEIVTTTPAEFDMLPKAVEVFVPEQPA